MARWKMSFWGVGTCVWLSMPAFVEAMPPDENLLVISARPNVVVKHSRVTVADVATAKSSRLPLPANIAQLDLAEVTPANPRVQISKDQIAYRIRMASLDQSRFRVEGAAEVVVTLEPTTVTDDEIITAAQRAVLRRLPCKPDDVSFQLTRPSQGPVPVYAERPDISLEADLRSPTVPVGKVFVDVHIVVRGERHCSIPVSLDVKGYQAVAVCSRRIDGGETLRDSDFSVDRRPLQTGTNFLSADASLAGKRVKHVLQPGHILSMHDVESTEETPLLVKRQERVKLIARVGPLLAQTVGEALQDGRDGQRVRVRNIDSKTVVVGRVTGRSIVEVEY